MAISTFPITLENISRHSNQTAIAMATYSWSFIGHIVSEKMMFPTSVANQSAKYRQPAKLCVLHKIHVIGRGLLKKHFCKTFPNICSAIAKSQFPIISQWQLYVPLATKTAKAQVVFNRGLY